MSARPPTPLDRLAARAQPGEPGRPSPGAARLIRWALGPLVGLMHRPSATGWEHLVDGPAIYVANHSGGGGVDVAVMAVLWFRRFGLRRPLSGLAHPAGFFVPGVGSLLRMLGAVPATHHHGDAALQAGVPLLSFPGGAGEAMRTVWRRWEVDFCGRSGFARMAARNGVPLVPVAIEGTSLASPVLSQGLFWSWICLLPRAFRVTRWGLGLPGLLLGALVIALFGPAADWWPTLLFAWFVLATPAAFLGVFPATVRVRFGPAVPAARVQADPEAAAREVEAAVQALLDQGRLGPGAQAAESTSREG